MPRTVRPFRSGVLRPILAFRRRAGAGLLLGMAAAWTGAFARGGETLPTVKEATAAYEEMEAEVTKATDKLEALRAALGKAKVTLEKAKEKAPPEVTKPQIRIPRMGTPPTIDGAFHEEEWAGAVQYTGAAGAFRMLARPGTFFYLGWDPDHVYFAQRMKMRPTEKPVVWNREPKHDNVFPLETVVEFYIDNKQFGSHPSLCRWQFMGNAAGNRWDMEKQYQIGQSYYDWDAEWEYGQRLTPDGEWWETEMAIPREAVYWKEPIKEGDLWTFGMAASLQHPFQWSGFYGYKVAGLFVDKTPVVRLVDPQKSLDGKRMVFEMHLANPTDRAYDLEVVGRVWNPKQKKEAVLAEKRIPVSLAPGETKSLSVDEPVEKARDRAGYILTIMVLEGERSVYTWSRGVQYNDPGNFAGGEYQPNPEPFKLTAAFKPLSNFLTVDVDKYYAKEADKVAKAVFEVKPEGKDAVLATGEVTDFSYGKGRSRVDLPDDFAPGTYAIHATLVGEGGEILAAHSITFERKDHAEAFPWIGSAVGEEDVLLKPFEPLYKVGDVLLGFKKAITLTGAALPERIEAAGVNLLASPVTLRGVGGGEAFELASKEARPSVETVSKTRIVCTGTGTAGPVAVETRYELEYDGTARVRLTLAPSEAGKPARLDALQLVLPFAKEAATHYMANGLHMRVSNQAGALPGEGRTGRVWDSTSVKAQKMTVGSFVPIVFLGNLKSGLTWFADNDRGWWPSDTTPAIEFVRIEDGPVEMILNLASGPVELDGPREIVFGLSVVPARPMSTYRSGTSVVGFGGLTESGRWDPEITKSKVYARMYPDNLETWRAHQRGNHRYGEISLPYVERSQADLWKEDFEYFKYEWGTDPSTGGVTMCESLNDYRLYWTDKWCRDGGVDGYYMDNFFCRINKNTWAGSAYALPDGRIQPGYGLWKQREYVRRLRTVFQKHDDLSMICIHNTRFQFAPAMAFADLAMGGEMATPRGGTPDFMAMYPRDFMDVMYNQYLWGYQLSHLYHYDWKSFTNEMGEVDVEAARKGHRTAQATMLVHGVEFFQDIQYKSGLMSAYRMFKKLAGGQLEFIPSWSAEGRFKVANGDESVDVAVYRGEDVLIVIAANYSEHQRWGHIWLDFPKLLDLPGPMEKRVAWDMETLEFPGYLTTHPGAIHRDEPNAYRTGDFRDGHNTMHIANQISFRIEPRDFRVISFVNLPLAKGAGF